MATGPVPEAGGKPSGGGTVKLFRGKKRNNGPGDGKMLRGSRKGEKVMKRGKCGIRVSRRGLTGLGKTRDGGVIVGVQEGDKIKASIDKGRILERRVETPECAQLLGEVQANSLKEERQRQDLKREGQ